MRYFIEMSYKGTNYNGWQIQDNASSVQQTVQDALSTLLRFPSEVVGAGRTDTGVHASFYVAHFDTETMIEDLSRFCYHFNSLLPFDIAVSAVRPVNENAHARFDAIEREYRYRILDHKDPFCRQTSWQLYADLDVERMNIAATHLLEVEDFTTFAKLGSGNKTNICHVSFAHWESVAKGELTFTIRSDRFLRNMIRAIVGTLVDVGKGKITVERFREIVDSRNLSLSGSSAPAQGLFLSNVKYSDNIYI